MRTFPRHQIATVTRPDNRLFGVSWLDVIRASTFAAEVVSSQADAPKYTIPVVGGHSGATILPLLSQSEPKIVRVDKIRDSAIER